VDDALTWIGNGEDDLDDPTGDFQKIDQLFPRKLLQKPEDRACNIEGALDWARNNDVPPEELASIPNFKKLPQQPSTPRPIVNRQKDLDRTLIWM
jgi:hypothetical protein